MVWWVALIDGVRQPIDLGAQSAIVGASLGVAVAIGPHVEVEALLWDADLAMYAAKEAAAGVVYSAEIADVVGLGGSTDGT